MPARLVISKSTAQGENFTVELTQYNTITGEIVHKDVGELLQLGDEVFKLADVRLMEMNTRMLEAYGLEKYFTGQVWNKIITIFDILAGRQSVDTVSRRWQSEIEETEALEQGRLNAMMAEAIHHEHLQYGNGHSDD